MAIKYKYEYKKTLAIAGILLGIFALIAALFGAVHSWGFVSEPLDVVYTFRYPLLLIGGYFLGYMLQPRKSRNLITFQGVSYGLFAFTVFFLLDFMRSPLRDAFGMLPYPWEKIMFEGLPLISLGLAVAIVLMLKKYIHRVKFDVVFQYLFITIFTIQQIEMVVYPLLISDLTQFWSSLLPVIIMAMVTMPLSIAAIAYIFLGKIHNISKRIFFSVLIGTAYFVARLSITEFSIDPMAEAVEIFGYISLLLILIVTTILIWCVRKAAQLKP